MDSGNFGDSIRILLMYDLGIYETLVNTGDIYQKQVIFVGFLNLPGKKGESIHQDLRDFLLGGVPKAPAPETAPASTSSTPKAKPAKASDGCWLLIDAESVL